MKTLKFSALILYCAFVLHAVTFAQDAPKPDIVNESYGQYEMNKFDMWKAKSDVPTPLVIYIHGGSFAHGDKAEKLSVSTIQNLVKAGISYMSINYRLTPEVSYPQHYFDCARAIQYARYHAKELNIDPERIALTGGSAGGCTSLWLAFHDDLADLKSEDPVLRMSTRVTCAAVYSAQTTLEPTVIKEIIGDSALGNSMFNGKYIGSKKSELNSDKIKELYKAASPVTYLSKDDPPIWASYSVPRTAPKSVTEGIHHPNFGIYLKEKMDKLGLQYTMVEKEGNSSSDEKNVVLFYMKHFKMTKAGK